MDNYLDLKKSTAARNAERSPGFLKMKIIEDGSREAEYLLDLLR